MSKTKNIITDDASIIRALFDKMLKEQQRRGKDMFEEFAKNRFRDNEHTSAVPPREITTDDVPYDDGYLVWVKGYANTIYEITGHKIAIDSARSTFTETVRAPIYTARRVLDLRREEERYHESKSEMIEISHSHVEPVDPVDIGIRYQALGEVMKRILERHGKR